MIRGLYTAATCMNSMQHQIDVTSNNIANVNTTGFKQDRAEFQDLMYESLNYTAGQTTQTTINPTGIDVGLGVRVSGVQKNFSEGDLKLTSNWPFSSGSHYPVCNMPESSSYWCGKIY